MIKIHPLFVMFSRWTILANPELEKLDFYCHEAGGMISVAIFHPEFFPAFVMIHRRTS